MNLLQEFDKENIFIIGIDGTRSTGDIEVCESFQELNEYLGSLNTETETDIIVLHGIISSAKYIPAEIGRNVYLIIQDPDAPGSGCIYETDYPDSNDLDAIITDIIKAGDDHYQLLDIDNVFIMYGYQLNTGYSVIEEELDEQVFEECKVVARGIKDVEIHDDTDSMSVLYGSVVGKCE